MVKLRSLPNPTPDFHKKPLPLSNFTTGHKWLRIHKAKYAPMHFSSSGKHRFDSPDCAVLYVAQNIKGAFVEVFCRDYMQQVTTALLQKHKVAEFKTSRALKLVDLTANGLVKLGLDSRIFTGDYETAQKWAIAFQEHPDNADGILYRSRHDPEQKIAALFARSGEFLTANEYGDTHTYLSRDLLAILDHYGISLYKWQQP